jgi:hypothetical protein
MREDRIGSRCWFYNRFGTAAGTVTTYTQGTLRAWSVGSYDSAPYPFAIVEDDNGQVQCVDAERISFNMEAYSEKTKTAQTP